MDVKKINPCTIPATKVDFVGDNRWRNMHERYVAEAGTSEIDVVFIGDSIIQQLQFTQLWIEKINSLHCLNFGIGGDRVEHLLWRILNGELNFGYPPKIVVLSVGTNNVDCTAQEVFDGICKIIQVLTEKLGNVDVVLPTLLPRGQHPNANRERNALINEMFLNNFDSKPNVYVVPIHDGIVQKDETISHYVMHDYLHLTNEAYNKVFMPVYEKVRSLLNKTG
ncbi:hypothetical protein RN001_011260 [Aquatica leii]|uniref:SGNH hydrolase-type esterase domain-containing protein n=1 Tax=Aquatica leii TaxID=1421715 RepID=A0AAN7P7T6_9COLE|nr:hypothetical protein RN001_011260 [Aquatica leii]